MKVILLLLICLARAQILDLSIQGYSLDPPFDPAITEYTADVPLTTTEVIFNAQNDNDRFWIQVFEDTCCDRSDFNLYFDFPVYDDSRPFDLSEGENLFFFTQENFENDVYTISITRGVITTTTTTTTTTTSTTTTTPGPTETQVVTETPVVALPEQSPDVSPCDSGFIDEVWVNLIAQEDSSSSECAALTVRSDNGEELEIESVCPCFVAADQAYLYSINCRPNEATMYTFSDMAHWCYGEEAILEGPTDTVIAFNKTLETFDISTWSGVDDEFIYPGQKMRQTFTGYDMDPENPGTTNYMLVEFDSCQYGTWEEGDSITVEIGFEEVYRMEMPVGSYGTNCGSPTMHSMIVPIDPYIGSTDDDFHDFTLGFTSNLAGARDDEYFSVEPTKFELFTRQDVSTYCLDRYSYNSSVNFPEFVQDTSGFIWNYANSPVDSIRLHLEVLVPRRLYDFTIDFDGGDTVAGYNEARRLAAFVNDPLTETYWVSDLLTDDTIVLSTQDNCGYETWYADIPWNVFNEEGAGGVTQFQETAFASNEDADGDWYLFGSTSLFTGYESVYTQQHGREWEPTRYSTWRVPFLVRFQRTVYVETTSDVILCPTDENIRDPYCTITHVAAIVEQVQANTVYDLESRDYRADVNLKIDTKVFYPYMLISGEVGDDPPAYWETYNQSHIYTPPLDGDGPTGAWFPPTIEFTPADYVPANTEVETAFTWLSEDTAGCTYEPHNDIALNLGRDCAQYWNMYIKPLNGACYIDGDYVVTWATRCFYDKPVCSFNTDDNGVPINTVQATFTVHSTNMCPEIIHETDIYGEICPTGRYDYALCAEAQSAAPNEDINTYFQDDDVHFFINTGSNDAKVIYTEILEIWVEQDFSDPEWAVDPTMNAADLNYDGLVKLYDSSQDDNTHLFTNSITGLTENVEATVEEVMNSNDFATYFVTEGHSADDTDYGVFAGFRVRVDSRIFPRLSDRWLDSTFRVKLLVWYEGWGDVKPDERRMLQETDPEVGDYSMGGKQSMWLHETIRITKKPARIVPCYANQEKHVWTLKMSLTQEQWDGMHGSFDHYMRREMHQLFKSNDIEWVGYTQDPENELDVVAVWRAEADKWDQLVTYFTTGDFRNGPMFYDLKTTDVYCLDASEDVGLVSLTECATGKPCTFLPGQVRLEDYYGQQTEVEEIFEASNENSAFIFSITMGFIWALFF